MKNKKDSRIVKDPRYMKNKKDSRISLDISRKAKCGKSTLFDKRNLKI